MDCSELVAEVLKVVFQSVPDGSFMYIDGYIDTMYDEGWLPEIVNYIDLMGPNDEPERYVGYYRINLSYECKEYLISGLTDNPYIVDYFVHYRIEKDDVLYLYAVDTSNIVLLDTLPIPEELIVECDSDPDVFLIFENPVTVNDIY